MIDLLLQTAIVEAIQRNSVLRFEMDGNKVVYIQPESAYNLNSEFIELRGSAEIVFLGGDAPNRFISRKEIIQICLVVDRKSKVKKMMTDENIPPRIEEDFTIKQSNLSKEELETPPFLRN